MLARKSSFRGHNNNPDAMRRYMDAWNTLLTSKDQRKAVLTDAVLTNKQTVQKNFNKKKITCCEKTSHCEHDTDTRLYRQVREEGRVRSERNKGRKRGEARDGVNTSRYTQPNTAHLEINPAMPVGPEHTAQSSSPCQRTQRRATAASLALPVYYIINRRSTLGDSAK